MKRGAWVFWWVIGAVCCVSGVARAECTRDLDCKGDRVCEAGVCTSPPALPPAPPQPVESAPLTPPPASAPASAAPAEPDTHFFDDEDQPRRKPKKRIGKPGMLAGGIVLAAASPILLVAGVMTTTCNRDEAGRCDAGPRLVAFATGSLLLLGVGIPLIVIGAKRVPVQKVSALPWVGPREAGLQLRLDLS